MAIVGGVGVVVMAPGVVQSIVVVVVVVVVVEVVVAVLVLIVVVASAVVDGVDDDVVAVVGLNVLLVLTATEHLRRLETLLGEEELCTVLID